MLFIYKRRAFHRARGRENMSSKAMGWRGIEFGGRLAVTACVIYIGSIVSALADQPSAGSGTVTGLSGNAPRFWQSGSQSPWQNDNDSSNETTDIDDADGNVDDLSFDDSSREDQSTPQLLIVDLGPVAVGASTIIRASAPPINCFYFLHEHIRERAPPSLRS